MQTYTAVVTANYTMREETLDGKKHLVVPVVMMVEGVHIGSHGPIFHRSEELSKFVESWNDIPVLIGHPQIDGVNVSARGLDVRDRHVGRIFNTHYDKGLKAEAWLDEQRLLAISPSTLGAIREGRAIDVSVGVFNEAEYTEGEWNGETYEAVARNYRPDHLALLPGERGACSWEDGCGIRLNQEGGNVKDLLQTFKELGKKGLVVSPITNEQGYRTLVESLQKQLDSMDTNEKMYFLQEVYSDHFVYEVRYLERGDSALYKRSYSVVNDNAELGDDPVEVRKKVEYVTMKRTRTTPSTNSKNDREMSKNEGSPCCEDKVDRLIVNEHTQFTPKDKEWLMSLEEAQIDKLSPVVKPEKKEEIPPQVNKEEVIDEFKGTLKTIEDYKALMPEAMASQFEAGVKLYKEKRDELVKGIMANSEQFEKEELEAMPDALLEKISKSVTVADYSGQAAGGASTNGQADDDEKLLPLGVTANKKEED